MLVIEKPDVPLRTDSEGVLRVGRSRVTLDAVIRAFKQGQGPEEIVLHFPALKLGDVYGVIHYYFNNNDAVEQYLREREREAEEIRRKIQAQPEMNKLRERLLARKNLS